MEQVVEQLGVLGFLKTCNLRPSGHAPTHFLFVCFLQNRDFSKTMVLGGIWPKRCPDSFESEKTLWETFIFSEIQRFFVDFQISATKFFFKIGIFPNLVFLAGSSRNDVQIRSNQTMLYGKISISAKFVGVMMIFRISANLKCPSSLMSTFSFR